MTNLLSMLNAADRVAIAETNFGRVDESLAFGPKPTKVAGVPNVIHGPPTDGAWKAGAMWVDADLCVWQCTADGTPGTWVLAFVPANPPGANCRFKPGVGWQLNDPDGGATPWRTVIITGGALGLADGEA